MSGEVADLERRMTRQVDLAGAEFEQLYRANRLAVLRFLNAYTGDEERALEIASITFERAWSECRRGRTVGLGWLLRCARNAAIDAARRDTVRERFARLRMGSKAVQSPEDDLIERDAGAAVRAAVARLPSPQREAIVLRFTTQLPVREIASLIGKREDATEKLISRAVNKLREDLHDHV